MCIEHDFAAVKILTTKDNIVKFKNVKHQHFIPLIIVTDFEACRIETCKPDARTSYSMPCQKYEAVCFAYYIICKYGSYKPPVVYRGEDASEMFMKMMIKEVKEIEAVCSTNRPVEIVNDDQKRNHAEASFCYACNGQFTQANRKVIELYHITGKYRGAACYNCNLNCKLPPFVPLFFHNL